MENTKSVFISSTRTSCLLSLVHIIPSFRSVNTPVSFVGRSLRIPASPWGKGAGCPVPPTFGAP